ncbi:MAG: DUF89 family protein [Bacteroidales bacterium]|nr:DUF89 family protein [Bacteroidales bacterium]
MISDYRCFNCFTKAFGKLIEKEELSVAQKNSFIKEMAFMYAGTGNSFSAPAFSRELHNLLRSYTLNADPYKFEKKQCNDLALQKYPGLKELILSSEDPFDTALRLAIAGNIIDYAATGGNFDVNATIEKVLSTGFAIDHSAQLKKQLSSAKSVLYLGDNAGEIVFDKLFIESLMHPSLCFAVRGAPVINDATLDDVNYIGMDVVADIVSNGYDAPSTILNRCSEEFQNIFYNADVIISKGQGNLEGLLGKTKKNIFYLLMVKCDVIADALRVKQGDFVVFNEQYR